MARAFPARSGCPVPSVSAISGLLVSSCKVDPPPEPIFQFPIFAQPLPNPPSFNFGCYAPSLAVTVATNQPIPYFHGSIGYPSGGTTGLCQPRFHFNVGFPEANCPVVSTSASITVLPVGMSPSVKFKVTNSDCNFKFDLNIGVPGGGCTSVDILGPLFDGPTDVGDGDTFFAINDADILNFTNSDGCDEYDIVLMGDEYRINIPINVNANGHNQGAVSACCTAFNVVTSMYSTTPGQLEFDYKSIMLPTIELGVGEAYSDRNIGCTTVPDQAVLADITISAIDGCSCGASLALHYTNLLLNLPEPADADVTAGTNPGCCEAVYYVAAAGGSNAGPSLVKDGCAYKLSYQTASFTIPQTVVGTAVTGATIDLVTASASLLGSLGTFSFVGCGCGTSIVPSTVHIKIGGIDASVTYVCSIGCVTSSLTYTTATLTFTNGVLTANTGCS